MKDNKTQSIFISVVSLISRTSFNIERKFKSEIERECMPIRRGNSWLVHASVSLVSVLCPLMKVVVATCISQPYDYYIHQPASRVFYALC